MEPAFLLSPSNVNTVYNSKTVMSESELRKMLKQEDPVNPVAKDREFLAQYFLW